MRGNRYIIAHNSPYWVDCAFRRVVGAVAKRVETVFQLRTFLMEALDEVNDMKAKSNELTVESVTQRYSLGHKALSVALSVVLMGFGWPAVSPSQVYAGDGAAADDAAAQVEGASSAATTSAADKAAGTAASSAAPAASSAASAASEQPASTASQQQAAPSASEPAQPAATQ